MLAVAALLAVIVSVSLDEPQDQPVEITGAGTVQRLFGGIHQQDAELGSPDAPVTIDLFNDLQCAFCDEYQLEVVPPLVEKLVRPGDARLVYRHFPLGEHETGLADIAAVAAGKQAYEWQFAQLFFENQEKAPGKEIDEEFLERIAAGVLQLDPDQWKSDFDSSDAATDALLEADTKLALELQLSPEPAAVVSGPGGQRVLEDRPAAAAIEAAVAEVSTQR